MSRDENFVDFLIRDGFTNERIICLKNVKYSKFKQKLNEYEDLKKGKIRKCYHWLLHNFPDLKLETRCKDCRMTVEDVLIERGKIENGGQANGKIKP